MRGRFNVGVVDASVGADEAQAMFDDGAADAGTQHFVALAQQQLCQTGVFPGLGSQLQGGGGGRDGGEVYQPVFGLADDFLRQHQDIAILQLDFFNSESVKKNIRQVVALADERNVFE